MIGLYKKRWMKMLSLWMAFFYSGTLIAVYPQTVEPLHKKETGNDKLDQMHYINAPLEQILSEYSRITGKTLIKAPDVPSVQITIESNGKLEQTEILVAIEAALAMHNIAFVPFGEKFLKVVQASKPLSEGQAVVTPGQEKELNTSDNVISQVLELENLTIQEAQPIIQNMIHAFGKIQPLERNNALLITDTEATITQIQEVLEYIDTPVEIREEPRIYEIRYAQAADIAGRLNEIISQSQQNQQQGGNASNPRTARQRTIDSLRRRNQANNNNNAAANTSSAAALAEKGIVQGKVQIVSDERTNILIIISDPVNFAFFDKIIAVLDRQVEPEITVKIIPLEFADASEVAGVLNDLIGAASEGEEGGAPSTSTADNSSDNARSTTLRDFINRRRQLAQQATGGSEEAKSALNQLSENTRILADERTNSLLIMGRGADILVIEEVLGRLDVMLAQVLIEAVIIEVNLNDNIDYGFDWLQRSLTVVNERTEGARGGINVNQPVYAFGGGQNLLGGDYRDGSSVNRDIDLSPGGLTYFATFFDFNVDAVVRLAAGSSDARVLSSPVILTTDNTEAEITVGEQRPIPTSSSTTIGGVIRSTYEYRDIGINLSVTPRINPNQFVTMEVSQSADNVGGNVSIDGNEVPIITRREMQATISVSNRTTIVLGGLVSEDARDTVSKIPFIGDLPLLGTFFRDTSKQSSRSEIIVLLTPVCVGVGRRCGRRDHAFA